jgi:hypothetical protein
MQEMAVGEATFAVTCGTVLAILRELEGTGHLVELLVAEAGEETRGRKPGTPYFGKREGTYAANDFLRIIPATEKIEALSQKASALFAQAQEEETTLGKYWIIVKAYEVIVKEVREGKMFAEYLNRMPAVQAAIARVQRKSKPFDAVLSAALKAPACNGSSLGGLMIAPLQRTIAYMLLIQRLVKETPQENNAYQKLAECSIQMEASNKVLDDLTRGYKNVNNEVKRVYHERDPGCYQHDDYLVTGRQLLKKSVVMSHARQPNGELICRMHQLTLFSDRMVISTPHGGQVSSYPYIQGMVSICVESLFGNTWVERFMVLDKVDIYIFANKEQYLAAKAADTEESLLRGSVHDESISILDSRIDVIHNNESWFWRDEVAGGSSVSANGNQLNIHTPSKTGQIRIREHKEGATLQLWRAVLLEASRVEHDLGESAEREDVSPFKLPKAGWYTHDRDLPFLVNADDAQEADILFGEALAGCKAVPEKTKQDIEMGDVELDLVTLQHRLVSDQIDKMDDKAVRDRFQLLAVSRHLPAVASMRMPLESMRDALKSGLRLGCPKAQPFHFSCRDEDDDPQEWIKAIQAAAKAWSGKKSRGSMFLLDGGLHETRAPAETAKPFPSGYRAKRMQTR